ncbi:DNA-binding ATP-dependent protease La [Methylocella tundrae]|uniref:Lon protease n=1 Tax=Methylocella tundrae TaxID=227605 RepID=A0A4U8Z214_METTU|nr:endopeptidase La [Methylocella tundrae]WPP03320.1 endopeptidase La [Methylocella tundrae]VFU09353.1 DNA-binding ATP-dependent protease La [Methylocella tundrae]VTZ48370.1 DNA-binding ATP-dependent protease La [Methylocella tundrae]
MTQKREPARPGAVESYPVLPLRDIVVFPHMIVPLFVGREKSIRALEEVMKADSLILLATQMNASDDDPATEAIFTTGTLASVLQLLKLPDGTVKVLVEGQVRAKVQGYTRTDDFYEADAEVIADDAVDKVEVEALARSVVSEFEGYVKLNKKISPEVAAAVTQIEDYAKLADTIASHLAVKIADKQAVLETTSITKRLEKCLALMESEISVLQVEKRIRTRVKRQMEKTQREYYLNEQMKAIQKELGDEDGKDDLAELDERIKSTKLSKEARDKATVELKKLRQMSPMSAEATVVRNYLDWLLSIPWNKRSKVKKDLGIAEDVLDAEHFGLEKVKERILEYLAVQTRANKLSGPILCLVGPPGVGKTSLGKSIAKATGREFVRMSLGGVRDEAEIRGHRRTYIGSMPGKIIQSMRKAKSSNPLFLLDEIDKMGMDFRGDPSSALLEVLDPEQNQSFNDHYLEVDYDLSNVMFVTTANTLNIPAPLMDRMEIIRIAGYTEDEKVEIARRHLIPAALKKHGLGESEWSIDDAGLILLIRRYTREAGVRNLEREVSKLARKAVKQILTSDIKSVQVTAENVPDFLGVPRFRYGEAETEDQVGVVTGLAWTEVGGELLTIEGVMMPGKGRMTVTGNLRDVMKESISAAASYVRSRAVDFGIEPPLFDRRDIHVHVPEGATPKDGPSAGVAMATAIVSIITGIPIRRDIAMTGEITLRGRILPIGGLKEKLLAALRGGLKKVLIPEENAKDLVDIPNSVKNALEIVPVARMDEVLAHALIRQPKPIVWEEDLKPARALASEDDASSAIAH